MARKRPVQIDDLFQLRAVGHVALSPDGTRVAYELKRFDAKENKNFTQIMLVDTASGATRPLTGEKYSSSLPRWSPDGGRLAFLSDREKGASLWVLPMSGGEPQRITDRDGCVSDFDWSPDGKRIAFEYQPLTERQKLERDEKHDEVKKRPQFKHLTRLRHKLDGAGWWNGHYKHIYVVAAVGGRAKQLSRGDFDDTQPRFSPDGRWVAYVSNRAPNADMNLENADIYVVRPTGGATRKIKDMQGEVGGYTWSPDSRSIAYIGNPASPGQWWKYLDHVWVLDISGRGRPRELTKEIDNACRNMTLGDVTGAASEAAAPLWSAAGDRLYFLVSEHGAARLYSRSLTNRDLRLEIGGDINLLHIHAARPGGPIVFSAGTQTNPGDVYLYDASGGDTAADGLESRVIRRLSDVNGAALRKLAVGQPEPILVRNGATTVPGWVLKPPGFDARRKYPAILEIHGGPHAQYGHSFFHEMQWLAGQGYVVVFTNPRGSAGYGLRFMNCIHADWGNLDYQDVMKVADWMFALPYVDTKRVGVTGGSYGGYMTNFLVGHTNRFRAAVTQRSVVNLESMFGSSDFGYHLGLEFGGNPWENQKSYRRQSPLSYVKNIRTPLLIEHEEEDHRCPIEQAWQLFSSLKVLGRDVELVQFEGESHGLSRGGRPQNRAERLRRIGEWFARHMK